MQAETSREPRTALAIHRVDGCIHHVSSAAPSLVPLLRSENQLKVLAALLLDPGRRSTITELVQRTGVPQPSVSREVSALLAAGLLVVDRERGRRVFSADITSPVYPELSSLLHKTVGPPVVLRRALDGLDGVHAAYVHGSWARRAAGGPGPEPGDIDVLVVGEVDVEDLRDRADAVSGYLGRDVDVSVLSRAGWERPTSGFVRHVRDSPLVTVVEPAEDRG